MSLADPTELALDALKLATKLEPALVDLLRRAVDIGKGSLIDQRVADILPAISPSEQAARELRAEQGG